VAHKLLKKHITSVTKSNEIIHIMAFWNERFKALAEEFLNTKVNKYQTDILAANFVQHPYWSDVIVSSYFFADIFSGLGPAVAGSIGIVAFANINSEKEFPFMFEPFHGLVPDTAGKRSANPIGIHGPFRWCCAFQLDLRL
jgi:tartrate dehydrogenase/decarboxylase/D-malate dehydrogenase